MRYALLLALLLLAVTSAIATPVTLTMDEVPLRPINGLTVTKGGIGFTFSDSSNTLFYHSGGPGIVTYVQDPSIQGPNVPLSVSFSIPVNFIQFGLAELSLQQLTGAQVTLSDGTNHFFDLLLTDPFSEGQFTYLGAFVTGFKLTAVSGPSAIAFDNLTVDNAAPVPEPSSLPLLASSLTITVCAARRKFAS